MDDSEGPTIEVRFVTKLTQVEYQMTDKPFRVPIALSRKGLSGIINHVLALETPKPFDFLINEEFLRTTISEYLKQKNLSSEISLTIEYVETLESRHETDHQHDDWVSSLKVANPENKKFTVVSGSYDNMIRVWSFGVDKTGSANGKCTLSWSAHTAPIKAVSCRQMEEDLVVVSASKDMTVRVWQAEKHKYTGKHAGSVECVDISPVSSQITNTKLCSGSWDQSIKVWDTSSAKDTQADSAKSKKRKIQSLEMEPIASLSGHTQCVSSVAWPTEHHIVSGSWDHTVQIFDVETGISSAKMTSNTSVHAIAYNHHTHFIASGHSDDHIRLWDPRNNAATQTLESHKGWVTALSWHPIKQHLLLSGSYDKSLKLWDTRAGSVPLSTLNSHQDKVLCVDWAVLPDPTSSDRMASGGADNKMNVSVLNTL